MIWGLLRYLKRHDFTVFLWYRVALAAVVVVLIVTNVRDATTSILLRSPRENGRMSLLLSLAHFTEVEMTELLVLGGERVAAADGATADVIEPSTGASAWEVAQAHRSEPWPR